MMYTDEELEQLESEERSITEEAIAAMLLILANTHSELEKELRNFYQQYGKDGVVTYNEAKKWVSKKDHRKRLAVLYLLFADSFHRALADLTDEFELMVRRIMEMESDFFDTDLDIDKHLWSEWGADDLNWLDRLEEDLELWLINVNNDVKVHIIKRDSIDTILEQLDERFITMERIIRTLVMTESTAVGSLARQLIFKELGIKKYRYYAREDERTCKQCGALHGLVFPISAYEVGVTASPIHPRCRCWEVPIK